MGVSECLTLSSMHMTRREELRSLDDDLETIAADLDSRAVNGLLGQLQVASTHHQSP